MASGFLTILSLKTYIDLQSSNLGESPQSQWALGESQNHTESQNVRGWKGPLWII